MTPEQPAPQALKISERKLLDTFPRAIFGTGSRITGTFLRQRLRSFVKIAGNGRKTN
jgi:hypothetical protein